MKKLTIKDVLILGGCVAMAMYAAYDEQQIKAQNAIYFPKPLSDSEIQKYSDSNNAVVVYPIFTQSAYKKGGFYDYYNGTCHSCTTIPLNDRINATYTEGAHGLQILDQLHYPIITDIDVDKNPSILGRYDAVILLHNEYMTKAEFDAVLHHKNVLYLYPNAMYAEIKVDYDKNVITLVRGHGYPDSSIANGFGYVTSSKHEYDINCKNYKWVSRPNGMQLTCFPEFLILEDRPLLQAIHDYPDKIPSLINESAPNAVSPSILPNCNAWGYCQKDNT